MRGVVQELHEAMFMCSHMNSNEISRLLNSTATYCCRFTFQWTKLILLKQIKVNETRRYKISSDDATYRWSCHDIQPFSSHRGREKKKTHFKPGQSFLVVQNSAPQPYLDPRAGVQHDVLDWALNVLRPRHQPSHLVVMTNLFPLSAWRRNGVLGVPMEHVKTC